MLIRGQLLTSILACCLAAGCAATQETATEAQQPNMDNVYRTGSRLPPRDPMDTAGAKTVQKDDWISNRREGGGNPYNKTN